LKNRPPTIADVARHAEVSIATVSRVLNGTTPVEAAKAERVRLAMSELQFVPRPHLRGRAPRMIGLVVPELQNPIFPALAEVVGGALVQRGFTPVLCTRTAGGLSEADYVAMLLDQQVQKRRPPGFVSR